MPTTADDPVMAPTVLQRVYVNVPPRGLLVEHPPQVVVVCWMLNVSATRKCISGTDLLRQFDVLPH